jgi:hypothetical protein
MKNSIVNEPWVLGGGKYMKISVSRARALFSVGESFMGFIVSENVSPDRFFTEEEVIKKILAKKFRHLRKAIDEFGSSTHGAKVVLYILN